MAPKIKGSGKKGFEWNGDLRDLLAECDRAPANRYSKTEVMRPNFCSFTHAESMKCARDGWKDGIKGLVDAKSLIFKDEFKAGNTYHADVIGDFWDAGAMAAGDPECCFVPDEVKERQSALHLHFNASKHCGVSQDKIIRVGAIFAEIVDRLRENGPLAITFWVNCPGSYKIGVNVDCDNDTSQNVIAFLAAHPGFLRRLIFTLVENHMGEREAISDGFGRPGPVPVEEGNGNIVFCHQKDNDGSLERYSTDEKARKEAERKLADIARLQALVLEGE